MKCDMRTMIKVAVGLGAGLLVAYAALPEARAFIQAIAPFICPAAMLFMMKGMRDNSKDMGSKPRENEVASGDRKTDPDKP